MKTCLTSTAKFFQIKQSSIAFFLRQNIWKENPALLFGLTVLTGISSYALVFGWIWGLVWGLYLVYEKKTPLLLLLLASTSYSFLLKSEAPTEGVG